MMEKRPLPKPPLDESVENQTLKLYAIVDCAHFDKDFYQSFIQNPMLTAESLFMRTLDEESAEAGPLLVKLDPKQDQDLIQKLQDLEQKKTAVVWLWTDKSFLKLADNILKPLLYGELEDGQKILIRYYDPRCIKGMLEVLKENESSAKKLANIKAWAFKYNDEYSYLI